MANLDLKKVMSAANDLKETYDKAEKTVKEYAAKLGVKDFDSLKKVCKSLNIKSVDDVKKAAEKLGIKSLDDAKKLFNMVLALKK